MSNFKGYFIRFNQSGTTSTFPHKYLAGRPTLIPEQRVDADAYRDANMDLHRVTIDNHKSRLEFETIPGLTLEQKIELETDMLQGRDSAVERKYYLQYWDDDIDVNDYKWGYFYLADITYIPIRSEKGTIVYDSIKYIFVEY